MDFEVRLERPEDVERIAEVNRQAFGQEDEARIVDALRSAGVLTYSFVAIEDGNPVGHLAMSPVTIESVRDSRRVLGLAPMAVLPGKQGRGIGSRLVRHALAAARQDGHPAVVVLGHPRYYPRFGFEQAGRHGIVYEFPVRPEAFMVVELLAGSLETLAGTAHYAPQIYDPS